MYRIIVELSCMANNDEISFYSEEQASHDTVKSLKRSPFDDPRLVLCRPVFSQEVDAGLDITKRGSRFDENVPEVTNLLDAFFKIKNDVDFWTSVANGKLRMTPSAFLARHIGNAYYDCMSCGMPGMEAAICAHLCEHPSVNLDELVYPGKNPGDGEPSEETWYTLGDWLAETRKSEGVQRVRLELARLLATKRLPGIFPMLPEKKS